MDFKINCTMLLTCVISLVTFVVPIAHAVDAERDLFMKGGMGIRESTYKFVGPETGWGVVKEETSYYKNTGKVGIAEIGDIFSYSKVIELKGLGSVFLAHVFRNGTELGKFAVAAKECVAYDGSFGQLTSDQQTRITDYFQLIKAQDAIESKLTLEHMKKNKDAIQLNKFKVAYNKTFKMAKEFNVDFKAAKTAATRMRASDKLRELKHTQSALKLRITALEKRESSWLEKNPLNRNVLRRNSDYVALEKKRLALKEKLPIEVD